MNETNQKALSLLAEVLTRDKTDQFLDDWQQILEVLKKHTVHALPFFLWKSSKAVTSEGWSRYQISVYQNITCFIRILSAQRELQKVMQGIPFVILKGCAAAIYYPHPELRCMGDIDIIVKPEHFEKAYSILVGQYKLVQDLEQNPRHVGFAMTDGIEVELHRYFSADIEPTDDNVLDTLIYEGIDQLEYHEINNYFFPILPTLMNGLVLLQHIKQHMKENGVGLRQIIDFYYFAVRNKDIINDFLDLTENVGLRIWGEVILSVCNKYFGAEIVFNVKYPNEVARRSDEVVEIIMMSGNFGRLYTRDEKRTRYVLGYFCNPIKLFKYLQKNGRIHWKAPEKYAILRPFIWIYQICHYIVEVRKAGIKTVISGVKRKRQEKNLWDDLG